MMLDQEGLPAFLEAIKRLDAGFSGLPARESKAPEIERLAEVLNATAERLRDNYPYFHPLYAGQMLKPPHPVARLAYALAMWINPNNHALDGGRATSAMEKARLNENEKWMAYLDANFQKQQAQLELLKTAGQLDKVWQ